MNKNWNWSRKGEDTMVNTNLEAGLVRRTLLSLVAAALLFPACANAGEVNAPSAQQTFSSPEQAAEALSAAWHAASKAQLLKIFGPAGLRLVSTGDVVAEKEASSRMAGEYDATHTIEKVDEKKAVLVLGKDAYPYPIPIVKRENSWYFDTKTGEEEILNRRIGRNELNAIEVCRSYVEAQREYDEKNGSKSHEYASKIVSSKGRHDGLYWPVKAGEEESPLGPLVASAAAEGYRVASAEMRAPYHGYYFKILTRQGVAAPGGALDYMKDGHLSGGFGLLAFPAKYGDSGVMTFIINQHGIVFEKNLGPHSLKVAQHLEDYNPDGTWTTPKG